MTDGYTVELKSAAYSGYPANVNPTGIDSATADSTRDTRSISYALTNSYKPQTTTVAVQKTWDGPAADSVSVKLQSSNNDGATWSDANGATATLTAEGGWTASFAYLPVYEPGMQGVKRTYRVVEEAVDIYETVYKVGSVLSDGFTVTNTADEKPSKPEEPAKPEQPKKTDKKGKLPGTGDTGYMAAAAVGMGSFLLLAAGVALRRRTDC